MLRPSTFSLVSSVLHWSSFLLASGASFSENSTICVVLVLASADHLSSFTVRFSWFLMRLTFGWILRLWVWCHEAVALKYSISNDPTVLGKGVPNLLLLVNGVSQFPAWPGWRGPCYCGGRGWGSLGQSSWDTKPGHLEDGWIHACACLLCWARTQCCFCLFAVLNTRLSGPREFLAFCESQIEWNGL